MHENCVRNHEADPADPYFCEGCQILPQHSSGNALFSSLSAGDQEPLENDSPQASTQNTSSIAALAVASSTASLDDIDFSGTLPHYAGSTEQFSGISSPAAATPTTRSSTPAFPQDGEGSDNDEYHPPGSAFLYKLLLILFSFGF